MRQERGTPPCFADSIIPRLNAGNGNMRIRLTNRREQKQQGDEGKTSHECLFLHLALLPLFKSGSRSDHNNAGRKTGKSYEEYQQFFVTDATFHDTIAHISGNIFLREALVRLNAHLHLYRLYCHVGTANETISEHRELLDALRQRNADAATACMIRHLEQARWRLIQRLELSLCQN